MEALGQELARDWSHLVSTHGVAQLAVLLLCVGAAYLVARLLRPREVVDAQPGPGAARSIWFGDHIVDGLAFPLIALGLVWAARHWMQTLQPVPILRLAVPLFTSLVVIRLCALVLRAAFPVSTLAKIGERFISWLVWLGAVLWVMGWWTPLLQELDGIQLAFGKTHISLRNVLEGLFSSVLVMMLALWLSATIEQKLLSKEVTDLSLRKILSNLVRALLLFIGLLFALSAVGVDLTALSVLGGALGVGLGFGLQKLAANYVSGFVLLFERSVRIGDMVRVDNFEGRITDIKTRYTLILAPNGRESIVPNEKLISERVENLTLASTQVLLSTVVSVDYDCDVARVQALLAQAALTPERVLREPVPNAHLTAFGADGLEFTLNYWIDDPHNGQMNVRSEVNMRVLAALRAAGVGIPYPQRVVHLQQDPPAAQARAPAQPASGAADGA